MNEPRYYLCQFRLDKRWLYVVWYSNNKDGLVHLHDGKIASFADERRAYEFCHDRGILLTPEPPTIFDFDRIDNWCESPTAESIVPSIFLNAWNMLDDAQVFRSDVLSLYRISSRKAD